VPPPVLLQEFVRYFWILEDAPADTAPKTLNTLVDDSSGLIIQHGEGHSAFVDSRGRELKTCFVYGQATHPSTTFSKGGFSLVGVHFQPHGLKSLFGVDACLLTDQMNDLDAINCQEIGKQVYDAVKPEERISILNDFLLERLRNHLPTDRLVTYCLDQIRTKGGQITVPQLLQACNISERQLERRFNTVVGIPPKLYIRVIRFREALRLMRQKQFNKLSDIAFELNYADQSHFIRDIREFSGYAPRSLSQEVNELVVNLHLGSSPS